ncbi:MAG: tryptophan synthase subunit alpha [Thermoplasmataceae archaeon]
MRNPTTILYFTSSFPDHMTLKVFLENVDPEVVKYVEIGFPSSDPRYDGPEIRKTHEIAEKNFQSSYLGQYAGILGKKGVKTYLLTYYRDLARQSSDFISHLRDYGFSGMIVPDLLVDYNSIAEDVISGIQGSLDFIPFFNPATPDGVIEKISRLTESWIYYGLQPATGIHIPYDLEEVSRRILDLLPGREVNFGFGVRTMDQMGRIMALGSKGVAIGTLLVPMIRENHLSDFMELQKQIREVQVHVRE